MREIRKNILRIILCVLLAAGLSFTSSLTAKASKETEEKIEKAKEEREATQQQINENDAALQGLNATREGLQGELERLNAELTAIGENLARLEREIADKTEEIRVTTAELEEATERADDQYAAMKKRVQFMYEKSRTLYLSMFFEIGNFSDYLNRQDYAEQLSAYDRQMLDEFIATREAIDAAKKRLEEEEAELQSLKEEATAEQNRVSGLVAQTNSTISYYSGQIAEAEAVADRLQDEMDAKNQEIRQLEAKLAEERRLEELSRRSVWRSIGDVVFAEGDRYLLANLIYCEAGNQPFDGQVAVGAVVMNRVMSGAFPDTIVGVIYQAGQFEPVMTGRLALALARDDATDACYQAADLAMAGQTTVADCIFFRTPIPQITPRYTIGGHIFY